MSLRGGTLRYCWFPKKELNNFVVLLAIGLMIFFLSGGQNMLANVMPDIHWNLDRKFYTICWGMILWLLFSKNSKIESLCGKDILKNSEHSFYVYILHFILLQTIVIWIFAILMSRIGFGLSVIVATVCCIIITAIVAIWFEVVYKYFSEFINRRMRG